MKKYVILLLILFLTAGCVRKDAHPISPGVMKDVECDAQTPCEKGYNCIKLPDKTRPTCVHPDILKSKDYEGCVMLESFPPQLNCPEGKISIKECEVDSDCKIGGCNRELCAEAEFAKQVASICLYKPEFECYKMIECKCINGRCGWDKTQEFSECFEEKKQL